MDLHFRIDAQATRIGQIYQQIQEGVTSGRLRAGESLPSTRVLAQRLGVSRNTIAAAYDRLVADGFVTTRAGAGTFVSSISLLDNGSGQAAEPAVLPGPLRPRPVWEEIEHPVDLSITPTFDFRIGVPDSRLFPYSTWRNLFARQFRASAVGTGMPCPPAGHPGLRASLTRHLQVSRGIRAGVEDLLVTSGTQQALDLVGRVLLEPGMCAAIEEPGYNPAYAAWRSLGARVVGVPVDGEGLVVDALPDDARLVYVTPSHQMPTGVAMSLRRRLALLSWARHHDAAIVEDDYDSEFRYTRQPLEPLQSMDHSGRVIYLGTISKILLPTLRIGYVVAPASLHYALRSAKFVADWHTNLPTQAALAEFIDHGGLARHLRRARREYRRRHDSIVDTLNGSLSRWFELIPSAAGLHVAALFKDTTHDIAGFHARTKAAGVAVFDFSQVSCTGSAPPGVVLGYGAIPTSRLPEGLERLQECLSDVS